MVSLTSLHEALLFTSADLAGDQAAYLDRATGHVYYAGDYIDEDLESPPDDLGDLQKYLPIPSARDLDLGNKLAFDFIREVLPDAYPKVRDIFSRKGAYGRFKNLLLNAGKLDEWHRFEERATLEALREWCRENEIEFSE